MKTAILATLALAFCFGEGVGAEPNVRQSAVAVLDKHGDVLATVKMTVVQRTLMDGKEVHKIEHAIEITGTVIDKEGTVAISASAMDFLPGLAPSAVTLEGVKTEFESKDTQLVFAGNRKVAAQFLGRDEARDLAFLKPTKNLEQAPHISFNQPPDLQTADSVIVLYPLTRLLHRRPAVALCSIAAIAKEKQKFAVIDRSELRLLGCPVFNAAGQPVGIATTLRQRQEPHVFLSNFENMEPDIVVMDVTEIKKALTGLADKVKPRK